MWKTTSYSKNLITYSLSRTGKLVFPTQCWGVQFVYVYTVEGLLILEDRLQLKKKLSNECKLFQVHILFKKKGGITPVSSIV